MSLQLTSKLMAKLVLRKLTAVLSRISRPVRFLTCYYLYHRLRLCVLWRSSRTGVSKFQRSCHFFKGTQNTFRRGNIPPTLFRNSGSKFGTEVIQPFQKEFYQNATVCRGTQSRQKTCVNPLVLRDDWNPSQSESS